MTTLPIGPIPAPRAGAPATGASAKGADDASTHKIREVAREFEAMLVRQMLTAAGVGGKDKEGAYAGMEVDALANGITKGKGLGLAQQIADALAREAHTPRK